MKQTAILTMTLLASIACQKSVEPDNRISLEIGLPSSADVKTSLGNQSGTSVPLVWSAGDRIIFNGNESEALASGGGSTATFTVKGASTTPYNILYCGKAGTDDTVTFPSSQTFVDGNVASFTLPMYASATSLTGIRLGHLGCAVKFALTSPSASTLSRVEMSAAGGEMISGDFTLGKNGDGKFNAAQMTPAGSNMEVVTMTAETALGSTAKTFVIVLPAAVYSHGFSCRAILSDGSMMEMFINSTGEKEMECGVIYDFGTTEFVPMGKIELLQCGTQNFTVETVSYE